MHRGSRYNTIGDYFWSASIRKSASSRNRKRRTIKKEWIDRRIDGMESI